MTWKESIIIGRVFIFYNFIKNINNKYRLFDPQRQCRASHSQWDRIAESAHIKLTSKCDDSVQIYLN